MKDENGVKDKINGFLKKRKIEWITITTGGFGGSGWPDKCFVYKGVFVGCEAKFGKNRPTKLQLERLDAIHRQGGIAMWVNETNVHHVELLLTELDSLDEPRTSMVRLLARARGADSIYA